MAAIGQLLHAGSLLHQLARPNPVSVTMPVALRKGCDIGQPRNLAKSVTVE